MHNCAPKKSIAVAVHLTIEFRRVSNQPLETPTKREKVLRAQLLVGTFRVVSLASDSGLLRVLSSDTDCCTCCTTVVLIVRFSFQSIILIL